MKIVIDVDKLLEEGRITTEEYERLNALAVPAGRASVLFAVGIGFGLMSFAVCVWDYLVISGPGNAFTEERLVTGLLGIFFYLASVVCLVTALVSRIKKWRTHEGRFPWVTACTTAVFVAPCVIGLIVAVTGPMIILLKGG